MSCPQQNEYREMALSLTKSLCFCVVSITQPPHTRASLFTICSSLLEAWSSRLHPSLALTTGHSSGESYNQIVLGKNHSSRSPGLYVDRAPGCIVVKTVTLSGLEIKPLCLVFSVNLEPVKKLKGRSDIMCVLKCIYL